MTNKREKEIRLAMELRANDQESESSEMVVEGYAITFDEPATHGFTEIISKGALDNCDMSDVPLKYNHEDTFLILARTRNKSLELTVDEKGLFIRATLIDTQTNRDVYKSIQAGLLDKMSFAFTIAEGGESWDYDTDTRTINSIDKLYDVSVVDTPFYDTTSIYARSLEALENAKAELENAKARKELKRKNLVRKLKIQQILLEGEMKK